MIKTELLYLLLFVMILTEIQQPVIKIIADRAKLKEILATVKSEQ